MTTGRINQVTIMCRGTANRRLAATAELVTVEPAACPLRVARTGDGWALGQEPSHRHRLPVLPSKFPRAPVHRTRQRDHEGRRR
jgi:hypothetical protein